MKALYSIGQPVFPAVTDNITVGSIATVGFCLGGVPGALIGGAVGYTTNYMLNKVNKGVSSYIRNGTGTIFYRAHELGIAVRAKLCATIHSMVSSVPFWIISKMENACWVQATHAAADRAYVKQCSTSTFENKSMNLQHLFTAVPKGVASQENVINALAAQAAAINQRVSKEQISQWVALGERLVQELSSDRASIVAAGAVVVRDAVGQEIYVKSSVYHTRAIMWYFTAQAVRGELAKQNVLLCGHAAPSDADIQKIVQDFLAHETFVFPDKNSTIFNFLSHAKTHYMTHTRLLCQDSALQGADQLVKKCSTSANLPAIDDSSRSLPNGARRTTFNVLMPVEGNQEMRLAIRLEALNQSTVLGQRSEDHESTAWHVAQMMMGLPQRIIAAVGEFSVPSDRVAKTRLQVLQHNIHRNLLTMLQHSKQGDAAWRANREAAYTAAKQLPLHELLPYLIHPEHATAYDSQLAVLQEISDTERDKLKTMIYRALLEGVQAGENAQLHRRANETLLMPFILGEREIHDYWRKQVATVEMKIFEAAFILFEQDAALQENQESWISWTARKAVGGRSATEEIQQRKTHEQTLFFQAYQSILDEAQAQTLARQRNDPIPVKTTIVAPAEVQVRTSVEDMSLLIQPDYSEEQTDSIAPIHTSNEKSLEIHDPIEIEGFVIVRRVQEVKQGDMTVTVQLPAHIAGAPIIEEYQSSVAA